MQFVDYYYTITIKLPIMFYNELSDYISSEWSLLITASLMKSIVNISNNATMSAPIKDLTVIRAIDFPLGVNE
jgi:hypothetical protein